MKNKIIVSIGIFAVIFVLLVFLLCNNEKDDGYNIAAESLGIEFNADVMVYGENIEFRDTLKYRTINEINEDSLNADENHGYRAIILYDHNGTMEITDEELLLIKKYVEEKAYDMIYIGKDYLDDFKRLGFTVGYEDTAYSFEYIGSIYEGQKVQQNEYGNLYAMHGLWSDEDEEMIGDKDESIQARIVMIMYDYAREAAGIEF